LVELRVLALAVGDEAFVADPDQVEPTRLRDVDVEVDRKGERAVCPVDLAVGSDQVACVR